MIESGLSAHESNFVTTDCESIYRVSLTHSSYIITNSIQWFSFGIKCHFIDLDPIECSIDKCDICHRNQRKWEVCFKFPVKWGLLLWLPMRRLWRLGLPTWQPKDTVPLQLLPILQKILSCFHDFYTYILTIFIVQHTHTSALSLYAYRSGQQGHKGMKSQMIVKDVVNSYNHRFLWCNYLSLL